MRKSGRGSITERRLVHPREVTDEQGNTVEIVKVFDVVVRLRIGEGNTYDTHRKRGFPSRAAAEAYRTQYLNDHDQKRLTPRRKEDVPFGVFLLNYIQKRLDAKRLRPSTAIAYVGLVERHLEPRIGSWRFADLDTPRLDTVFEDLGNSGLSASTVRQCAAIVSGACVYAVRKGWLARNPMPEVELPRVASARYQEYDVEKLIAVLEAVPEHLRGPYLLDATTGLRRSEVAGLTWGAIDFDKATVTVARGVHRLPKNRRGLDVSAWTDDKDKGEAGKGANVVGNLIALPPKSESSTRTIPLGRVGLEVLRKARLVQAERFLAMRGEQTDDTPCFDRGNGLPLSPDTISHVWEKACEAAGVAGFRFHDVRGHHATSIIDEGFDLKLVSELLGHAQVSTTLKHYAKERAASRRRAVDAAESRLAGLS